jgi:diguanylate cyclase (GGDEF)-like protein/PAS domain S-box-containing protein
VLTHCLVGAALLFATFSLHGMAAWRAARLAIATRSVSWTTLALAIGLLIVWRLTALHDLLVLGNRLDVNAELLGAGISLLAIAGMSSARRQETALRESEQRFRALTESAMDAILIVSVDGRMVYANPAVAEIFGHPPRALLGRPLTILIPDPAPAFERPLGAARLAPPEQRFVEVTGRHADGHALRLEVALGQHLENGRRLRMAIVRDVTERERLVHALKSSQQRYALAAEGAGVGLFDWDIDQGVVHYSRRFAELLGVERSELAQSVDGWLDRIHPDDLTPFRAKLLEHVAGRSPCFEVDYRVTIPGASHRWMRARGLTIRDPSGRATRMAGSQADITEQKRTEERLTHGALHDGLTGLPNRALLTDRLGRAMARGRRNPGKLAVLAIDLDRMNVVNESFGHAGGDELLMDVARKLLTCTRPGDTIARVDGDQFVVLLEDLSSFDEARQIAERVQRELATGTTLREQDVVVTASIGSATNEHGASGAEEILRAAEAAMYRAKGLGRARHELSSDSGAPDSGRSRLALEADLRRAVEREEIQVAYQPIVSLLTGRIGGFEALARWHHPERGQISPGEFIPLAEDAGILPEIERRILSFACSTLASWQSELVLDPPLSIAVNVTPSRFQDDGLVDEIQSALAEHTLVPGSLKLEITESMLLGRDAGLHERLQRLRALGVRLVIDDFGTGYSSLSYLHELPIDTLKIDQSFIVALRPAGGRAAVVETILALARQLGLETVAEGVENADQLACLRELGCEWAQGYFFARPLPAGEAGAMVRHEIEVLDATRITGPVLVRGQRRRGKRRQGMA